MYCSKCGTKLNDNAAFCSKCGTKLEKVGNEKESYKSSDNNKKQRNIQSYKVRTGIIGAVILLVLYIIGSLGNKESVQEEEREVVAEEMVVSNSEDETEAEKIFEAWVETHPLDCEPEYELLDEYSMWGEDRECYKYALMLDGAEYWLYIDKKDGSMFIEDEMEGMSIENWYDIFYGDGVEDIYETSINIDYDLVGRWRNEDGGMLEFDEFGNILNCDFRCWTISDYSRYDGRPNYITWEAFDGRVTCNAHFQYCKTYEITKSEEDGQERLRFDGYSDWHVRDKDRVGEGIIGRWLNEEWGVFNCEFYEDGSGLWNNKYPISWYAYVENQEGILVNMIEYTIYDSSYFDYYVNGDSLVVYLSDGSRIYTRVGN